MKGDLTTNLGRVFVLYTGAFAVLTLVLAGLEQAGLSQAAIGYAFLTLTIGIYAAIGVMARTAEVSEYYVAGRRVPAFYNGMATGADWMSAASFVGMAGTLYALGYDGLAFVLGWTGGFVLVGVLLAPYLRKFGQYTVPDFLGARYGGNLPRALGVAVLLACSFAYLVAQVYAVGLIAARFLDIPFAVAVYVGLGGILVCSMLGGMRAVTWTQVAQYLVVFAAYLVPAVWLSWVHTGIPVPQLSYGQALARIAVIEQSLGVAKPHAAAFAGPDGSFDVTAAANFFALILCLMVGTASLPHILTRYFTTPSVREARQSVAWSLFFIVLVYLTAPAYAAFAKLEVYTHLAGNSTGNVSGWLADWVRIGLAGICDTADAASALCKGVAGNADGTVQLSELRLDPDAIVLATPGISNMPFVITGLVAAGGLAAALATADGLLLAIANALSHDIYYRILQPRADSRRRLLVSRLLLVVTALVAASVAAWRPASIMTLVAWAFSIAASGLFPALVLGIWWKRASNSGACAGIVIGSAITLGYIVGTQFLGMAPWFGIQNVAAGAFGLPAAFLATVVVSLMTKPPSAEMQAFIDSLRVPRGRVNLDADGQPAGEA